MDNCLTIMDKSIQQIIEIENYYFHKIIEDIFIKEDKIFNTLRDEVEYITIKNILQSAPANKKIKEIKEISQNLTFLTIIKKLLLDYVYLKLGEKIGRKSFSDISFTRLIFILNQITIFRIININELKHLVIENLEKEEKFQIDRKTLTNLLYKLEMLGLVKLAKYEITMSNSVYKYTKKDEIIQHKILAMTLEINENDELYKIALNNMINSNNKKGVESEIQQLNQLKTQCSEITEKTLIVTKFFNLILFRRFIIFNIFHLIKHRIY